MQVGLPFREQPRGIAFFFWTWSGRILLANFAVFIVLAVISGSAMMPSELALYMLGIKDPVLLASGEYWRLITPMFIHIGALHFLMNSYMLYVIGYQIEAVVGGGWFFAIYMLAGIFGNIASATFSLNPSAGASGAIFGLLGCGFYIERSIGSLYFKETGIKPRLGAYAMTILLNVGLGLMIPFIDNAAHLGGLIAGLALTYGMFKIRPNRLDQNHPVIGRSIWIGIGVLSLAGAIASSTPSLVVWRFQSAANAAIASEQYEDADRYLTRAIRLSPDRVALYCDRGSLRLLHISGVGAARDLRACLFDPEGRQQLETLYSDLQAKGRSREAWQVKSVLDNAAGSE